MPGPATVASVAQDQRPRVGVQEPRLQVLGAARHVPAPHEVLAAGVGGEDHRAAALGEPESARAADHVLVLRDGVGLPFPPRRLDHDHRGRGRVHAHRQRARRHEHLQLAAAECVLEHEPLPAAQLRVVERHAAGEHLPEHPGGHRRVALRQRLERALARRNPQAVREGT